MANNRDPRKKSRTDRNRRTSSTTRSARSKASAKDTPRPTSSATRNQRGSGAKSRPVVTQSAGRPRGASGPRSASQQGPRQKVSGLIGSRSKSKTSPPNAPGRNSIRGTSGLSTPKQVVKGKGRSGGGVKGTLAAGLVTAAATGALRNPVSKAKAKANRKEGQKATLNGKPVVWNKKSGAWKPDPARNAGNYNTKDKDGTVRSRKKVGAKKVGSAKVGSIAEAFDKAYGAAKKSGYKTFTFKGKKYTTD
jgi:hypothetical protein